MKILIVAQNLFIARLLVSLAEAHQSVNSFRIILFSRKEKYILSKIHGVSKFYIKCPSDVSKNIQQDYNLECIEIKRGIYSRDTVKRLQSDLSNMLELLAISDFHKIFIFNQHTFIGSFLKNSQELALKCVVFENSNKNNGVTILGDLFGNSAEDLRNLFLHPNNLVSDIATIRHPKLYRIITSPFHFRSAQAWNYYFFRILVRAFNLISFFLIKYNKVLLKWKKRQHPIILIALQIKDDSAVTMNIDFSKYCKKLLDVAINVKNANPRSIILVRPHPLDYTLGWLSFYNLIRCTEESASVIINCSKLEDLPWEKITHLITYNSNIVRHNRFVNSDIEVVIVGKPSSLPKFSEHLLQIHDSIF